MIPELWDGDQGTSAGRCSEVTAQVRLPPFSRLGVNFRHEGRTNKCGSRVLGHCRPDRSANLLRIECRSTRWDAGPRKNSGAAAACTGRLLRPNELRVRSRARAGAAHDALVCVPFCSQLWPGPMTSDHKKSIWPWISALLIGLPLLYVASFGPACWLHEWKRIGESSIPSAYFPLLWVSERARFADLLSRYATGGKCPAEYPFIAEDGHARWGVDLPER